MEPQPKVEIEAVSKRILVVEDDVLVRLLIADGLRDAGLQVIEAHSGEAALGYLSTGSDVDLVFSDIQMPGTIDGVQLARRVHGEYPDLPVILTSGTGKPADMCGARQFLPKPYEVAQAVALILAFCGLVS